MLKFLLVCGLIAGAAVGGAWWADSQRAEPAAAAERQQANRAAEEPPPRFIATVEPEPVPEGVVYHVHPTRAGRLALGDDLDVAFDQAVALGLPEHNSIRYQFMCHPLSVIGRAKSTWDLESWRPDVGQVRTMLAGCDPQPDSGPSTR